MPQLDPEAPPTDCARAGANERTVACDEDDGEDSLKNEAIPDAGDDLPPESFWLSKDAEYDWFDRNAFYDRKDSARGNPNSTHLSSNSNSQPTPANIKSKASIIGLPKTQQANFVDSKRRYCKATNITLFPKRSELVGKSSLAEPSSPKVSCMGRVRSKRGRITDRSNNTAKKTRTGGEKQKTRFWYKIFGLILCIKDPDRWVGPGNRKVVLEEEVTALAVEPQRKSVSLKPREIPISDEPVAEPPGLGGMKRFASGRRSGSWTAEDLNQAILQSLDSDRRVVPTGEN